MPRSVKGPQRVGERGAGRQRIGDAGDLVEEGPGLVGEVVGVVGAHAGRLHRDAAREVRQLRPGDDLPRAARTGLGLGVVEEVLGGPVLVERGPPAQAQDVEGEPVGQAEAGARHREGADQPGLEAGGEGRGVLVLDLADLVGDGRRVVPDDRAQRQRPLGDLR
ncbi:hypothetical protein, partial [Streptomyces yerevanensis]|uniref:hypothetical protein n=1 Tax=Streptomyces yerevanensis TaxID=66378 RepID=UPI0005247A55